MTIPGYVTMAEMRQKLANGKFKNHVFLVELPTTEYSQVLDVQNRIVDRKLREHGPDVVLTVEHPPTVTLGLRGSQAHLLLTKKALAHRGVSVFHVERGGQATFHCPGQLVVYPLIDLKKGRISVREYVSRLEESILRSLSVLGVQALRIRGSPGVWINTNAKIGSVGVRIQQGITSHGFSLNVDLVMNPDEFIVSCGKPGIKMTSINEILQAKISMGTVHQTVKECLCEVFQWDLIPCTLSEIFTIG